MRACILLSRKSSIEFVFLDTKKDLGGTIPAATFVSPTAAHTDACLAICMHEGWRKKQRGHDERNINNWKWVAIPSRIAAQFPLVAPAPRQDARKFVHLPWIIVRSLAEGLSRRCAIGGVSRGGRDEGLVLRSSWTSVLRAELSPNNHREQLSSQTRAKHTQAQILVKLQE